MSRVAVAMSGGVDSSVAAAMLHQQGHDVVGITLQLWDYSALNLAAGQGRCCSPADIADARAVAADRGFAHFVFDHSLQFQDEIVEPFLDEWSAGLTPSPCIRCNRSVKFGLLWQAAGGLGADALATGHYARIDTGTGRPQLRTAVDADKDQSYFLFDVEAGNLDRVLFPLGEMDKRSVRAEAHSLGLRVADKPESFELCFIPDGDKDGFVETHRPGANRPGTMRNTDGDLLGKHAGTHRFTIGQRRGLGVPSSDRLYVLDVDPATATVTVGSDHELYHDRLIAARCNWLSIEAPQGPVRIAAKVRHRHQPAAATITPAGPGTYEVVFDDPQRAIAPGQGVAFYSEDLLLGGGWITRARA